MWRRDKVLALDLRASRFREVFYLIFLERKVCPPIFALPKERRVRLRARTPPFHGGDTGSNPVRGTTRCF